ncbi:hypothetical protein AVEN_135684-1 [Araneus ventricosus]|uniref:Uncharacterized protein n=1 Tax=Araneus ventricosus TaxID=182803 RepID=A0A4Y2PFF4_ARAVE|nr:hypothetical protein AVEN_135684-1 [Araneus ventricosus]
MLGLPMLAIPRALSPIPDEKPRAVPSFSVPAPSSQVFRHQKIMVVLTIDGKGFTVTTGRVSYSSDQPARKLLRKVLANTGAQKVFFTDVRTKNYYKRIFCKSKLPYQTFILSDREKHSPCVFCHKRCHRWVAINKGIAKFNHMQMDPIPH